MFFRRRKTDPHRAHAFVPRTDPGMLAASTGGGASRGGRGNADYTATTFSYLRDAGRCGVPGCERLRDDSVHAVAE